MRSENSQKCSIEGVSLTKSLIARRNLAVPMDDETLENISQALSSLEILRLDRERISHITDLEGLEQIHSIYLQQNQIKKIENLSCLPNLKFLSLAGNQISKVENLRTLLKLQFLDLSQNCIKTLDIDELPQSLVVLDLTGNKCTNQNSYRERVLAALPLLKELDTKSTPSRNTPVQSKEEDSSEDSDYEEWPGLSRPLSAEKDFFVDLHEEFTSRSARRREEAVKEHEAHLEELKQQQKLRQLIFDTSHNSPKALSTSKLGLPVLEYNMLQTEHHTASNQHLKTENASFSTSAPKKKTEGKNQTQLKNL
uniref:Leucine rich repeat containing 46 n=1 Tax=Anolis carolinensis TaxID=28377 RepID=G1KXK8_ANOCA|nr:PREDICTED: leucine-rich repeat-containing protein 46 isoform X2 [Anolis carolinensis]|eukprot:XP_008111646.1 PREDICTED: leucine-rich repeat-containing protein 46 isoform X2 [Anolis carolinensis]